MIPKFELTNCLIKVNTVFNVFSLPYLVYHPRINVEFLNFSCEAFFPQTAFLIGLFQIRVDAGPNRVVSWSSFWSKVVSWIISSNFDHFYVRLFRNIEVELKIFNPE